MSRPPSHSLCEGLPSRKLIRSLSPALTSAGALLAWSRREIADLAEGSGWDAEYPRDAWQMHRLGFEVRYVLNFSRIPQQQLKDLAKRWIRWRLSTGLGLEAGGARPMRVLTRLTAFLHARGITGADGINRAVLEDYLADLHAPWPAGPSTAPTSV